MIKTRKNNIGIKINIVPQQIIPIDNIKSKFNVFDANEIVPNLWLGSKDYKLDHLEKRNICYILNLSPECIISDDICNNENIIMMKMNVKDNSDFDITAYLNDGVKFIYDALNSGNGILVHCRMGISRSSTFVIAYLMYYGGFYFPHEKKIYDKYVMKKMAKMLSKFFDTYNSQEQTPISTPLTTPLSTPLTPCMTTFPDVIFDSVYMSNEYIHSPLTFIQAFNIVKKKREMISPNLGFCLALRNIDVYRGLLHEIFDSY